MKKTTDKTSKPSKTRKKRSDRTHYVYSLEVNGLQYVGITAKTCSTPRKSVLTRFNKHVYRARTENKDWALYKALRKYGPDAFEVSILETLRGKKAAHAYETELIHKARPALNTASNK